MVGSLTQYLSSLETCNTALSWWTSVKGRRVVRGLAVVGVSGVFLRYYLPNTHFLPTCQEVTQLYRNGFGVPEPQKVTTLIQDVMKDLGMKDTDQKLISSYTVYGYDPYHLGSTWVRSGGILGLPFSFRFATEEEFQQTGIVVNNEPVVWSSPAGQSLKQSLVFSEDAKKFAIARELVSLSTGEPFVNGTLASAVLTMVYVISSRVNKSQNFFAKPRLLRLTWYSLVGLFGSTFWALGKDLSAVEYEAKADKAAGQLGEAYARGGLEYYNKVLQKNMALRTLMGDKGERVYTAYGNDELLLRMRHQPFTLRRDYMKTLVEEYDGSKEVEPVGSQEGESSNTSSTQQGSSKVEVGSQEGKTFHTSSTQQGFSKVEEAAR